MLSIEGRAKERVNFYLCIERTTSVFIMLLPITLLLASVHSVVSQLAVSDGKLSVISSKDGISSLQTE